MRYWKKRFEDFPKDPLEFRTALYEWLKETPFRLNFNQRLFEDTLQPFEALKSSDLQALEKNGELKLYPELILGIFPQAGSYLVPDYNLLLQEAAQNELTLPLFTTEDSHDAGEEEGATLPASLPKMPLREEQILTPAPPRFVAGKRHPAREAGRVGGSAGAARHGQVAVDRQPDGRLCRRRASACCWYVRNGPPSTWCTSACKPWAWHLSRP